MKDRIEEMRKAEAARVGRVLADVRKASGLSQSQLAERFGASISYVTRLEAGARGADLADLVIWCQTCGIPSKTALLALAGEPAQTGNAAVEISRTLSAPMLSPTARLLSTVRELEPGDVEVLQSLASRLHEVKGGPVRN